MTGIDRKVFDENLLLTQAYCELQLQNKDKNPASIFRSINPEYNGNPIFLHKLHTYKRDRKDNGSSWFITEWAFTPWKSGNEYLYVDLFYKQMDFKRKTLNSADSRTKFNGKVLIASIDETVVDGASEAESNGLIDGNDFPPIDTWFYLTRNKNGRILYAWIPQKFVELANSGIAVNCVECIKWDTDESRNIDNLLGDHYNSMPEANKTARKTTIWPSIKRLFSK